MPLDRNTELSVQEPGRFEFVPDRNCWRVEQADKLALIVDGADYFKHLRQVMISARAEIMLIGWDFDFEIDMLPGESDENGLASDGLPNALGPFLEEVVARTPDLHIFLLKWNGSVLVAPGRILPAIRMAVFGSSQIHFALDGHHPFGACHHQKIVTVDDHFAFCGGIDATENRWDTPEHLPEDPRRVGKNGAGLPPWHDITSATCGPVAGALAELSRERWFRATGERLSVPPRAQASVWPESLRPDATDVSVAIARTMPPFDEAPLINEIEELYLDSIRAARETIYIESQYFAAEGLSDALEARLRERGGPQIICVNPQAALSQFEDAAMHSLRDRIIDRLSEADHEDRFRIYYPVTTAGEQIYVHAKAMIVDSQILHLGSSNLNNRSMGFDTECDIAITRPADVIESFQNRLLSEHLGVRADTLAQTRRREGSMIAAIGALNGEEGRRLCPIGKRHDTLTSQILAQTRIMDPRYTGDEETTTGQGIRPRHIFIAAALGVVGYLGWRWTRK